MLASRGHNFTVTELADSTRTAKDAANAIGCTESQIAKSLIFKNSNTEKAVLIIASGSNQVSVKKLEAAIGYVDLSSLFLQQFDWYLYKVEPA